MQSFGTKILVAYIKVSLVRRSRISRVYCMQMLEKVAGQCIIDGSEAHQKIYACNNVASEEVQQQTLDMLQLLIMLKLLSSKDETRLHK